MKYLHISSRWIGFVVGITLISPVFAVVSMDYVSVGNAGNADDSVTGFGSVSYAYQIGKYEVTNAQYCEFLNAKGATNSYGIYNANMAGYGITQNGSSGSFTYSVTSTFENKPVVYVSWYDAARFANWLHNGQGSGDMESGAYTLSGNTGLIIKNVGATVWIPSEDEWYKAAYYNGNTASYTLFANGQNSITTAEANFNGTASKNVGTYSDEPSFYGTFDQVGNVWEWNDAVVDPARGIRGGSWSTIGSGLQATDSIYPFPSGEGFDLGFRLASIPEPSMLVLTVLFGAGIACRRQR